MIILDLMLPRMSGLELCRKLRAEGVQPHTDADCAQRGIRSRASDLTWAPMTT